MEGICWNWKIKQSINTWLNKKENWKFKNNSNNKFNKLNEGKKKKKKDSKENKKRMNANIWLTWHNKRENCKKSKEKPNKPSKKSLKKTAETSNCEFKCNKKQKEKQNNKNPIKKESKTKIWDFKKNKKDNKKIFKNKNSKNLINPTKIPELLSNLLPASPKMITRQWFLRRLQNFKKGSIQRCQKNFSEKKGKEKILLSLITKICKRLPNKSKRWTMKSCSNANNLPKSLMKEKSQKFKREKPCNKLKDSKCN